MIEDDAYPERALPMTIWYPAANPDDLEESVTYQEQLVVVEGHALRDAPPAADTAPFPLIVFSHGSGGTRFQSIYLMEHLASHGFVVMAVDHPGNTIIDAALYPDEFAARYPENVALRPIYIFRVIYFSL